MTNLLSLWAMYREIPGWLWICKALGVDEEGLRQLEEMDEAYIQWPFSEDRRDYEKNVDQRIREFIEETPKEYRKERRKEYLTTLIKELSGEIEGLQKDYEDSLRNDESYDNRAVLAYALERIEKAKSRHGAELKALNGNGKEIAFDNKLTLAKQRKFSEFLEIKKGKALCPFHSDRYPSFSVKDNRGHCFGCGWRGDVVDFVMALKGFSFREALDFLA
jgi:DNA primase (bacterial type)